MRDIAEIETERRLLYASSRNIEKDPQPLSKRYDALVQQESKRIAGFYGKSEFQKVFAKTGIDWLKTYAKHPYFDRYGYPTLHISIGDNVTVTPHYWKDRTTTIVISDYAERVSKRTILLLKTYTDGFKEGVVDGMDAITHSLGLDRGWKVVPPDMIKGNREFVAL